MKKITGKNIILELIPSHSKSDCGHVVQLSALKLDGLKLVDRFDWRVVDELVNNKDLLTIISYDKDSFNYTENEKTIMNEFYKWCEGYHLLIIDNDYTLDYLKDYSDKESIFNYLDMKYNDAIIDDVVAKYHLESSNYIVDLLYEALIYESNN